MALKILEVIGGGNVLLAPLDGARQELRTTNMLAARDKKIKRRGFEAGAGLEMGGC
jgi:hypothetical protein